MSQPPLDPRLLKLLQAVIEEYVETAQPVGSQTLVERHGLGVSSATVRNWFAELDELGHVIQPHTSGGRVPTESGYRLYLLAVPALKALPKKTLQEFERAVDGITDQALRTKRLARALADFTGLAVFVRFGSFDSYYTGLSQLFAQPEFRDWQRVVSLSGILDGLDEALQLLAPATDAAPVVLVGSQSPFGSICSTMYLDRSGILIGVLGPLRMDYARIRAALEAVSTLLS